VILNLKLLPVANSIFYEITPLTPRVPSFENQEMNGNDNDMANFRYTYSHFGPILSIYMWGVVMGSKEGPYVELSAFRALFSIKVRYQKRGLIGCF
jgi:hypothetical protein